jgi:hypothetical protein
MQQPKSESPVPRVGGNRAVGVRAEERDTKSDKPSRRSNQELVATIDKSHSCQLRVSLSTWRGYTKLELADFTSVVSGIYFQAGAGVSIDIAKLPELLKAIVAAEREAIARGLL